MNIVFAMCGNGKRFIDVGYNIPKYLISFNGAPMIYHAVNTLKIPGKIYFIVKTEHLQKYSYLEKMLLAIGNEIIPCETNTRGAAETLLLSKKYINDIDSPFLSVNCDQYLDWDSKDFLNQLEQNPDLSYIPVYKETSEKCSYVRTDEDDNIIEVREKQVISNDATIGLYHWAKTKDFFIDVETLINNDIKENGEYYVAPVYNISISRGLKIKKYHINNTDFWPVGTPEDLANFKMNFRSDL